MNINGTQEEIYNGKNQLVRTATREICFWFKLQLEQLLKFMQKTIQMKNSSMILYAWNKVMIKGMINNK